MNIRNLFFTVIAAAFASCTQSKYATQGAYESDDAYVTEDDTYISDFALVDDEAQLAASDSASTSSDDYYDPNYTAPSVYTPNAYNSYNANPWGCNSGYGSGFGSYNYGSYWNPYSPMVGIGWSPYSGYYTQYGMGFGYNPYCSTYYSPYSSWYTPYYSPYYYNSPAYNPYYSPYNYYNSGWGGYGGTSDNQTSNTVYGPRNPISALGTTNSSYTENVFYSGIKKDGLHSYVNSLNDASKGNAAATSEGISSSTAPSVSKLPQSTPGKGAMRQPSRGYTPAAPSRVEQRPAKPGFHTTPARSTSPTQPGGKTGNDKQPNTGRKAPSRNSSIDRHEPASRPSYESPRSSGRESSPSRSSSPVSSPGRSGGSGGGGSTNSPRRK